MVFFMKKGRNELNKDLVGTSLGRASMPDELDYKIC